MFGKECSFFLAPFVSFVLCSKEERVKIGKGKFYISTFFHNKPKKNIISQNSKKKYFKLFLFVDICVCVCVVSKKGREYEIRGVRENCLFFWGGINFTSKTFQKKKKERKKENLPLHPPKQKKRYAYVCKTELKVLFDPKEKVEK